MRVWERWSFKSLRVNSLRAILSFMCFCFFSSFHFPPKAGLICCKNEGVVEGILKSDPLVIFPKMGNLQVGHEREKNESLGEMVF